MSVTAIIPARYASTRFPGKPLADIHGKSMIQMVYEGASRSELVDRVIVATDDERIRRAVRDFGGEVVMTKSDHPTGTDRLAEAARDIEADLIVNVQGDEPLIDPRMIDAAVEPLLDDPRIQMGTVMCAIETVEEYLSSNVVKVVTDLDGFALYFSRAPIPHPRDFTEDLSAHFHRIAAFKHIGLYVYRKNFLLSYPELPPTTLETLEKLEQLRALEHGVKIRVVRTELTSFGVDVPDDLARVKAILGGPKS